MQTPAMLSELGFRTCTIDSPNAVSALLPPKRRSGIYVLHFDTGRHYVGQSVDACRRYLEHCRIYPNIVSFSFKPVKKDKIELDAWEYNVIQELEAQGFPLLNIVHASISYRSSDFDTIMPLEEQAHWLSNLNYNAFGSQRHEDEAQRSKQAERYQYQLPQDQLYAEQILPVLKLYIQRCIPRGGEAEASHWNCSYLPSTSTKNVYARLNINWQAVFSAYMGTTSAFFDFWLASSPFLELSKSEGERFSEEFRGLEIGDETYNMLPGGGDQVYMIIRDPKLALKFIEHPTVLRAIRIFNLNLMKKGKSPFNKFHCPTLIDAALEHKFELAR